MEPDAPGRVGSTRPASFSRPRKGTAGTRLDRARAKMFPDVQRAFWSSARSVLSPVQKVCPAQVLTFSSRLKEPDRAPGTLGRIAMTVIQRARRPSRRRLLALGAGAIAAILPRRAASDLRIDLVQGNARPLPIAVPDFVASTPADRETARAMARTIATDLRGSGLFAPIDTDTIADINSTPPFAALQALGAHCLVAGRVTGQEAERLRVEFRLWDVVARQQLMGQQLISTRDLWRHIAHTVAEAIHERLIGEKVSFD